MTPEATPDARRAFLKHALRGGALGALAALGAVAIGKSRRAEAEGCPRKNPCEIGHELFACERPEAAGVQESLKARRAKYGPDQTL